MAREKDSFVSEFAATGVDATARAFGLVGNAANGLFSQLARFAAVAAPISAALGSIGGALSAHKIAEVGGAYENVRNRMAGTLGALGFADDFTDSLEQASGMMDKIYAAAAKLPGEAEDYIEVITTALPDLQSSVKGGLDSYIDYANRYTAVAKSLSIDTMQAANDLQRMLQAGHGGAGLDVRTFTKLLPYFRSIEGHSAETAQTFNALSQTARADLLGKALAKLDPMVANMANSWEAVTGAVATAKRDLIRMSTANLFEGMKKPMQAFADLILDSKGQLTTFARLIADIGQRIGASMSGPLERVAGQLTKLRDKLEEARLLLILGPQINAEPPAWLARIDKVADKFGSIYDAGKAFAQDRLMLGAGSSNVGRGAGAVAGALGGAALTALVPGGAIVGALLGPFMTAAGAGVGAQLGALIDDTGVSAMLVVLGDALAPIPGLLGGLLDPLFGLWTALMSSEAGLVNWKLWLQFGADAVTTLVKGIVDFADPIMRVAGPALRVALDLMALAVLGVTTALGKLLSWIGDKLGLASGVYGLGQAAKGERGLGGGKPKSTESTLGEGGFSKWLKTFFDGTGAGGAAKAPKTPPQRAVGNTVQDFRGSRFTIQQDFAKNFDPDRVAVAFAKDVERIGAKRLNSAFEPLFGVG